jgi:UDP-N-acetylglucosamine acyltransferase
MVGMGTPVTRDIPPFATAYGVPARVHGVNRFGMARAGVADQDIAAVEQLFAEGTTDAPVGGLAADVAAELDWSRTLAGRRPMTFAAVTGEA